VAAEVVPKISDTRKHLWSPPTYFAQMSTKA
jgi:hypothetical protein